MLPEHRGFTNWIGTETEKRITVKIEPENIIIYNYLKQEKKNSFLHYSCLY